MFLCLVAAVASSGHMAAQWGRVSSEIHVPCDRGFPSEEAEGCHKHSIEEGKSDSAQLLLLLCPYHFSIRGAPKATSEASTSCAQLLCSWLPTSFRLRLGGEVLRQLTAAWIPLPPQGKSGCLRAPACSPLWVQK